MIYTIYVWTFCKISRSGSFRSENDAANHSPAKPCHTMHSNAATRFLSELGVEQLEPLIHNLIGRRGTIIKGPVLEGNKRFCKFRG